MSGFLALPRAVLSQGPDGWFVGRPQVAMVYVFLVCRANFCDSVSVLPYEKKPLKIGQLVIGREEFARHVGISVQKLRTTLALLEHMGKINQQTNQRGTLITINDYVELFLYRPLSQRTNQPTANQQLTNRQPPQDKETKRQGDKIFTRGRARADKPRKKIGKRQTLDQEAKSIGRLLLSPTDAIRSDRPRPFVDVNAIDACMSRALELYGIESLRALRQVGEEKGRLGNSAFDPNAILHWCKNFAAKEKS